MSKLRLVLKRFGLQDIGECGMFDPDLLACATDSKDIRRTLIQEYRDIVVRPALLEYDRSHFEKIAAKYFS